MCKIINVRFGSDDFSSFSIQVDLKRVHALPNISPWNSSILKMTFHGFSELPKVRNMSVSPTSALQVLHEKLGKAGALEVIRSHRETHITKAISEVDNSQIVSKFQ